MYYQYIGFLLPNFIGNFVYLVVCVRIAHAYHLTIKNRRLMCKHFYK